MESGLVLYLAIIHCYRICRWMIHPHPHGLLLLAGVGVLPPPAVPGHGRGHGRDHGGGHGRGHHSHGYRPAPYNYHRVCQYYLFLLYCETVSCFTGATRCKCRWVFVISNNL